MPKIFVLDTNVLLHSPQALWAFSDNTVIIPEVVLEELDKFKKEGSELGANARYVARFIDGLREKGQLNEGVPLDNGGILKVEMNHTHVELPLNWDTMKADNRIIQVCKGFLAEGHDVRLVTKDVFERIKADVINVPAEDFQNDKVPVTQDQYSGRIEVFAAAQVINDFYQRNRQIAAQETMVYSDSGCYAEIPQYTMNQFVVIRSEENIKQTALGRYDGQHIVPLRFADCQPFGVVPRNTGQRFMQECLFTDAATAPLVIIKGPAGTAKTFFALAVGLQKVYDSNPKQYRKILVCRPNVTMDEEIGFLPGNEQEKISPLMRPIRDNLQILMDNDDGGKSSDEKELDDKVNEFFDRKLITTEALAYLRGRSLLRYWLIIDEAQNLTPKQVKGIITRAGVGTKIILLGDPAQIDHPFLDSRTNGLCYAAEKMKGSPLCYQITMLNEECERSQLAAEGASRM